MKILLTAPPRTGKSTVLKNVIEKYKGNTYGILALEVLDEYSKRVGFQFVNMQGESRVFMHTSPQIIQSEVIVGNKYFIDIQTIENFAAAEIRKGLNQEGLIIIDEIGRAQSNSVEFLNVVRDLCDNNTNFIGTIVYDDEEWAREFKTHPNVTIVEVTLENREDLAEILIEMINSENSEVRIK